MRPCFVPFFLNGKCLLSRLYVPIARNARLLYSLFLFPRFCHTSVIVASFHNVIVLFQVENNGFEPLTLCVQSRCSSQLS